MKKMFLVCMCLLTLFGCSKKEKLDYDKVQMNVPLSSSMLGRGFESNDEDIISELWNFCQKNEENDTDKTLYWRITFFDSANGLEKIYCYPESQSEAYGILTEMFHQYTK